MEDMIVPGLSAAAKGLGTPFVYHFLARSAEFAAPDTKVPTVALLINPSELTRTNAVT